MLDTTYISGDLAYHETLCAQVGKGGKNKDTDE